MGQNVPTIRICFFNDFMILKRLAFSDTILVRLDFFDF